MKATMLFEIDHNSDLPLWVQLRQRIVHLISSGHYRPGDQLPTVRGLAADLAINYNTVNKAYLSLTHDGYIMSVRGRGVFVSAHDELTSERVLEAEALLQDLLESLRALGLTTWEIRKLLSKRLRELDLACSADGEGGEGGDAGAVCGAGDSGDIGDIGEIGDSGAAAKSQGAGAAQGGQQELAKGA
jgi:GntR family transcriptional regulator